MADNVAVCAMAGMWGLAGALHLAFLLAEQLKDSHGCEDENFHLFFSDSGTPFVRCFGNCISELRIFQDGLWNLVAVSRNSKDNQSRIDADCLGLQIPIIQLHLHLKS